MIKLSNGHAFEYMAASGALRWDGKGWPWERPFDWAGLLDPTLFISITKTLTFIPEKGNHWWNSVRFLRGGVANAVKLRNPGFFWWCEKFGQFVDSRAIPLITSIFGELDELIPMARILNNYDLVGIEFNPFCPNIDSVSTANVTEGCRALKEISRHPLFLKLSVACDFELIVKEAKGIVEAININSVPWEIVFPNRKSPFPGGGGAVSGKIVQPYTWGLVKKLCQMTDIPVIGPSIWNYKDMAAVRNLGAQAVSFGSVFMLHPWRPTIYIRREQKYAEGIVFEK